MIRTAWAAFGVMALMAGCAAPAIHYYSLASSALGSTPEVPASRPTYGLRLQVSEVPAEVDRMQLVVRDPASGPSVQVLNRSLWSAPLRDQIQERLSGSVAGALGVPDLNRMPGMAGLRARTVTVRVTRFDLVWDERAVLEADWTDHGPGASAPRLCRAGVSLSVGAGMAALVDGQRRALQSLGRLIAGQGSTPGSTGIPGVQYSGCT